MTQVNFFGPNPPPGDFSMHNDDMPAKYGSVFYFTEGPLRGRRIVGGRAWIPAGNAGRTITFSLQIASADIPRMIQATSTPVAWKSVAVTDNDAHWLTAYYETAVFTPNTPRLVGQVIHWDDHSYPHSTTGHPSALAHPDHPTWYWSEQNSAGFGGVFYSMDDGETVAPDTVGHYGVDIILDVESGDDTDPEPEFGDSISAENALAGVHRMYWFDGVDTEAMPAFGRSTYYAPGDTFQASVDYDAAFEVEIYRLGHYGSLGGRRVSATFDGTPINQPSPTVIPNSRGAVTCSHWDVNVEWAIPENATPGWYYALLKGQNGSDFGSVIFTVSDVADKKPILLVSSDSTWHAAYNGYGGNNLYGNSKSMTSHLNRAFCSTYDKPVITKDYVPQTHFFNSQFAAFKYMESLGFEVGYATIEQLNNDPTVMDDRDVIVFAGHNEYIPQRVMDKTKSLLTDGQKIINWAANDFFWRVAFSDETFPLGATDTSTGRVMWCRKDTMDGPDGFRGDVGGTPITTQEDWTGTWQDTRWTLREPSNEFMGDRFIANGIRNDAIRVDSIFKEMPIWRECNGILSLNPGQSFSFGAGTLGMEWDMPDGDQNMVLVSATNVDLTSGGASDANGEHYNLPGIYQHGIALVEYGAGLVFNFNSDQWGIALDNFHLPRTSSVMTTEARQASLNVLVDFGAVPNATDVSTMGLTLSPPVENVREAYGLADGPVDPEPEDPEYGVFYSNGTEWIRLKG